MAIEHRNISDPDLHEPKGVATAAANTAYVANGSGSGTWRRMAQGSVYFENISTPYTLTYPATYTKVNPTTTASGTGALVTEATTTRLTYTGTPTILCNVFATISIDQSAGANRDIRMAVYKNGTKVDGSVVITTTQSALKQVMSIQADVSMATNDYVEIYAQNDGASGDLKVYTLNLMLESMDR